MLAPAPAPAASASYREALSTPRRRAHQGGVRGQLVCGARPRSRVKRSGSGHARSACARSGTEVDASERCGYAGPGGPAWLVAALT